MDIAIRYEFITMLDYTIIEFNISYLITIITSKLFKI